MGRIRLVVFDVAGTIIEDHGEVLSSFQRALQQNGITVGEDELREWKGASKREVIWHFVKRQGHDPGTAEKTYRDFRQLLEEHYRSQGVTLIAGAERTFSWLRERKIKLATTTGFYREVNDLILEKTGWRGLFDAVVSSSDVSQGRPAPFMILRAMEAAGVVSVAEVMNVGDTPLDLQAGSNAGVAAVVGVLTGLHGEDRLRREPHTHIIPSVAELPRLIELSD
ncbi:MAG TPA: phosphonatase-like hydrolase [Terriglobales bacterium]|nr:phosphonatase-like hydrolase [Terriglobales bacterium]